LRVDSKPKPQTPATPRTDSETSLAISNSSEDSSKGSVHTPNYNDVKELLSALKDVATLTQAARTSSNKAKHAYIEDRFDDTFNAWMRFSN
jgi:hypothetical protein